MANPGRAATLPDVKTVRELGYPGEIQGLAEIFGNKICRRAVRNRIAVDCRHLPRHRYSPQTGGEAVTKWHDRGVEGGDRNSANCNEQS